MSLITNIYQSLSSYAIQFNQTNQCYEFQSNPSKNNENPVENTENTSKESINYIIAYIIIYHTILDYGLSLHNSLEKIPFHSHPEARFPPIQCFDPKNPSEGVIIRILKSTDDSLLLQGLGSSEDVLKHKFAAKELDFHTIGQSMIESNIQNIEYKKATIQKFIVRFQNTFLFKLLNNQYGSLHLAGLSSNILVSICSYFTIKDLGRFEQTSKVFQNIQEMNSVWESLYMNLLASIPESVLSSVSSNTLKSDVNTTLSYKISCQTIITQRKSYEIEHTRQRREQDQYLSRSSSLPDNLPISGHFQPYPYAPLHPITPLIVPYARIYPTHPRIRLPGDENEEDNDEFMPPPSSPSIPFDRDPYFIPPTVVDVPGRSGSLLIDNPVPPSYRDPLTGLPTIPSLGIGMGRQPMQPYQRRSSDFDDPFGGNNAMGGRRGGGFGGGGFGGGGFGGGF